MPRIDSCIPLLCVVAANEANQKLTVQLCAASLQSVVEERSQHTTDYCE